jgi:predicted RNase H-like HicB family nuclease
MKRKIDFKVIESKSGYTATAVDFPIVTEADSFEELEENVQEAVDLYFESSDFSEAVSYVPSFAHV